MLVRLSSWLGLEKDPDAGMSVIVTGAREASSAPGDSHSWEPALCLHSNSARARNPVIINSIRSNEKKSHMGFKSLCHIPA